MNGQSVAQRAGVWLRSTWNVQAPNAWLEACVEWLQQEGGGSVPQARLNPQVLEQWLLTDLRDLSHPMLPAHLSQALKAELSGSYCLQVDSLLDVSQPAYVQLQQWRGVDRTNEQVSAVTQASQRPWEATPTRMLMLKVTDGVQDLEAMEYRPIPALSASLPPGTKILVQGTVACRLGVLLLKPENVRVLGGEVEELKGQNFQGRVLCRVLGLPEEAPQGGGAPHRGDEGPSDEELLASLQEDEQMMARVEAVPDSGYGSRSEVSDGSLQHIASQRHHSLHSVPVAQTPSDSATDGLVTLEILDEEFEDIPLEELDRVIALQEQPPELGPAQGAGCPHEEVVSGAGHPRGEVESAAAISGGGQRGSNIEKKVFVKPDNGGVAFTLQPVNNAAQNRGLLHHPHVAEDVTALPQEEACHSGSPALQLSRTSVSERAPGVAGGARGDSADGGRSPAISVELNTPPFTYLSVLLRENLAGATVVRLKAFIFTLTGSLQSSSGVWQVKATISDGTGYLDVCLSDEVLVGLIGFSVAESKSLKKDASERHRVTEGLQRCQRELVDMCCLMTVRFDPTGPSAEVLHVDQVTEENCSGLERRVSSWTRR
ncbi:recQ-mediated genome instability protein 1 [Megalops cyprinoides]|uniref:recQ-mediated genome instability protein 1 n=1 Tax=Megalops cyprinoides TaxID=118141 RepID=UPI0018653CA4|nr:recQ-mediated genome instability protein 1 [Megalops cyprinoides]